MTPNDIRNLRANRRMSQSELAEHLGLSVRTIQQWEQGLREPGDRVIQKMRALQSPKEQRRALVVDTIEDAAQRAEDDSRDSVAAKLREIITDY